MTKAEVLRKAKVPVSLNDFQLCPDGGKILLSGYIWVKQVLKPVYYTGTGSYKTWIERKEARTDQMSAPGKGVVRPLWGLLICSHLERTSAPHKLIQHQILMNGDRNQNPGDNVETLLCPFLWNKQNQGQSPRRSGNLQSLHHFTRW